MRAKQIFGGVFALGFAGIGILAFAGQDKVAAPDSPLCSNSRLSYPDQASCTHDMRSAVTSEQQTAVIQKYQDKINATFKDKQTAHVAGKTKTN